MEMSQFTSGPVNIGSVLGRSLQMLLKRPVIFFGLALLAAAPYGILTAAGLSRMSPALIYSGAIILSILGLLIQGATAYIVFHDMAQKPASLSAAIASAMKHIVPLFLAALLTGIAVGIGALLLIIPGVILMCVLAVTIPACMVEKLSPMDSLKRSVELTKGFRWQIFALVLIVAILNWILSFIIQKIGISLGSIPAIAIAMILAAIIPQAFNSVMMSVIYHDLRSTKEGVNAEALANVFD